MANSHHLQENGKEEEETSQGRLEENLQTGISFFFELGFEEK